MTSHTRLAVAIAITIVGIAIGCISFIRVLARDAGAAWTVLLAGAAGCAVLLGVLLLGLALAAYRAGRISQLLPGKAQSLGWSTPEFRADLTAMEYVDELGTGIATPSSFPTYFHVVAEQSGIAIWSGPIHAPRTFLRLPWGEVRSVSAQGGPAHLRVVVARTAEPDLTLRVPLVLPLARRKIALEELVNAFESQRAHPEHDPEWIARNSWLWKCARIGVLAAVEPDPIVDDVNADFLADRVYASLVFDNQEPLTMERVRAHAIRVAAEYRVDRVKFRVDDHREIGSG